MTENAAVWISTIVAVLALAGTFLKFAWPPLRRFFQALDRTFETINGRPAIVDRAGREVEPSEPSLRVQLADIKATVSDQQAQNDRITAVEVAQAQHARMLADHAERFSRLDGGQQLERLMARNESTQAFRAMEAIANQEDPNEPV